MEAAFGPSSDHRTPFSWQVNPCLGGLGQVAEAGPLVLLLIRHPSDAGFCKGEFHVLSLVTTISASLSGFGAHLDHGGKEEGH